MDKLKYKRTIFIGLAFLSISSFWQMYDSIIPLILQNTFQIGETMTGVVMALDNIFALMLLPFFGALSDKVDTKYGKRMPFIVVGTILAMFFLVLLPIADQQKNFPFFMAALFGVLLSMGIYRSPAVALMPDLTPNRLRSKANAIINLMGAVGGVYALLMISILIGKENKPSYVPLFTSIIIVMFFSVGILIFTISERKIKKQDEELSRIEFKDKKNLEVKTKLTKDIKRSMIFMLLSIFLWFMAYNGVTTAFSRYTRIVWGMEGGSFANSLMVATIAAILSYIPIGNIASRVGRKKTIMVGILLMTFCYGIAIFIGKYHFSINIIFALIGIGWAAINVNSYPMIVAMSQGKDIGKFTGTYYTFSMLAQIITPILSGILLENISYRTLFPYAFMFSGLAFLTMIKVKHGDVKPQKKEKILENFDIED